MKHHPCVGALGVKRSTGVRTFAIASVVVDFVFVGLDFDLEIFATDFVSVRGDG